MNKREVAEGCGKFVGGEWRVRNLQCLTEFMEALGLSTGDVAKAVGLGRNAVTRWLTVDDTYLSKVVKVAEDYGYDFQIAFEVKTPVVMNSGRTSLVIDKPAGVQGAVSGRRLDFVRRAMKASDLTVNELAAKMSLTRNSVQLWFRNDDITFRYIYQIADTFDWNVNIRFCLADKN